MKTASPLMWSFRPSLNNRSSQLLLAADRQRYSRSDAASKPRLLLLPGMFSVVDRMPFISHCAFSGSPGHWHSSPMRSAQDVDRSNSNFRAPREERSEKK